MRARARPWRRRPGAALGAALLSAGLLLLPAGSGRAEEPDCAGPESPIATARMQAIEANLRGATRLLRMQVDTHYRQGGELAVAFDSTPAAKVLWGAFRHDTDPERTQILFVFSGPGRMAGTSLLIRDLVDPTRSDETWFYLRAFDTFQRLYGAVERTLVPSTALSYEDARGYVAAARYRFLDAPAAESGAARILACPRSAGLAERLGYGRLYLELDPERPLVRRIDYRGLGGAPLKVYELEESTRFEGRLLPSRASLSRLRDGLDNRIHYEYWSPTEPLPDRLFSTDLERAGSFLSRLTEVVTRNGQGERLNRELSAAQALVEAHERRFGAKP